jgi:hypothetical protein
MKTSFGEWSSLPDVVVEPWCRVPLERGEVVYSDCHSRRLEHHNPTRIVGCTSGDTTQGRPPSSRNRVHHNDTEAAGHHRDDHGTLLRPGCQSYPAPLLPAGPEDIQHTLGNPCAEVGSTQAEEVVPCSLILDHSPSCHAVLENEEFLR